MMENVIDITALSSLLLCARLWLRGLAWNPLIHRGTKQNKFLVHLRRTKPVEAVAVPVVPSSADDSEYRKQLAESYGFRQIGEDLPNDITLKQVIDTLPKEVFEIDDAKAWKSVIVSVTSYALGLFLISKAPWYLLPLAWAWTGTAATGVSFEPFTFKNLMHP
ncbi:hypothetical protein LINPERHAP1_LOCUS25660 [Linum perenne]